MVKLGLLATLVVASLLLTINTARAATEDASCTVTSVAWDNDPTVSTKEL
jgi:hypothetical protein